MKRAGKIGKTGKGAGSAQLSPTSRRTQAKIIDAVVETVARHGISGTTLANVAGAAGVSQGVLIFHFRGKDALLAETLRRLLAEYEAKWRPALRARTPLARILGLIRADFSAAICARKKLALWFAFWGEAGAQPLYSAICADAERIRNDAMFECCRQLPEAETRGDAELLALAIDNLTDGLWLQMHLQGPAFPRARALRAAFAVLRLLLPEHAEYI
jgi:TetR/AcrR family transcriptional repressor of bet genes